MVPFPRAGHICFQCRHSILGWCPGASFFEFSYILYILLSDLVRACRVVVEEEFFQLPNSFTSCVSLKRSILGGCGTNVNPFDRIWVSWGVRSFPERFMTHWLALSAVAETWGGARRCCKRLFLRLGFSFMSELIFCSFLFSSRNCRLCANPSALEIAYCEDVWSLEDRMSRLRSAMPF